MLGNLIGEDRKVPRKEVGTIKRKVKWGESDRSGENKRRSWLVRKMSC